MRLLPAFLCLGLVGCSKFDELRGAKPAATPAQSAPTVAKTVATASTAQPRGSETADGRAATSVSGEPAEGPAPELTDLVLAGGTPLSATAGPLREKVDVPANDAIGQVEKLGFVGNGFGVCGVPFKSDSGKLRPRPCALIGRKFSTAAQPREGEVPVLTNGTMPTSVGRDWKYGAHIELVAQVDAATGVALFGGSLDGQPPEFVIKLNRPPTLRLLSSFKGAPGPKPPRLAAATGHFHLSPDGSTLAGYGVYFLDNVTAIDALEFGEGLTAFAWDVDLFAAAVMQEYGYGLLKKRMFTEAAQLFANAAMTAPRWQWPRYNEACAWAKAKQPEKTRAALIDSLARTTALGVLASDTVAEMKARAKKDLDLAPYRTSEWFQKVTE